MESLVLAVGLGDRFTVFKICRPSVQLGLGSEVNLTDIDIDALYVILFNYSCTPL